MFDLLFIFQISMVLNSIPWSADELLSNSSHTTYLSFLSDQGIPGVRSMGPSFYKWLYLWLDLTDVTLADEDTKL